jgi:lipoate---protein ligase
MLFIENPSLDPWFNIATEEYLLKHFDSQIAMIWRSNPSIIVGKHQNTLAEINLDYVVKNDIPVVRRLSGGGTVFHDPGNINFTFIKKADKERMVDFKAQVAPVIEFLNHLGIDARMEGKNDIRVNGLKISGNAEHVFRDKVLHHGTLLFDADLDILNLAIKASEEKFESKAVKSVRSKVVNISSLLSPGISRDQFILELQKYLKRSFGNIDSYHLTPDDTRVINKLREEKYLGWEWNFGYSPTYTFSNSAMVDGEQLGVELTVSKGNIVKISFSGNYSPKGVMPQDVFKGIQHNPDAVLAVLKTFNYLNINSMNDPWLVLGLFF